MMMVCLSTASQGLAAAATTFDHDKYQLMIHDLDALITTQRDERHARMNNATHRNTMRFVDEYHELEEIHQQMQLLATNFPDVATYVDSIGESHEGNKIPVLRFGGADSKLTFWIQGCIHAREWISPATVMYVGTPRGPLHGVAPRGVAVFFFNY